jgi:hypothetical protein
LTYSAKRQVDKMTRHHILNVLIAPRLKLYRFVNKK